MRIYGLVGCCAALGALTTAGAGQAGPGDALIHYNLGLAAQGEGQGKEAYKLFKKACLARDGVADACLAWGEMASEQENDKDVKRALSSAVILAPADIRARFALAMVLLKKEDFTWAIQQLEEAVPQAEDPVDRALLRYYLAYAQYKQGEHEEAGIQFGLAQGRLPEELAQRCLYYRALIAKEKGARKKALVLMEHAAGGPDPQWVDAAQARLVSWSAFPERQSLVGQVSGSFGLNTYPSSAFLDDSSVESSPVLQSIFRGDLVYGQGTHKHGLLLMFTAYREQNWVEIGDQADRPLTGADNSFVPQDFNVTLFLLQAAYVTHRRTGGMEHELRLGLDGETQFLDHIPEKVSGVYRPRQEPFGLNTWALAGKLWWSFAWDPRAIWGVRFKVDYRPNYIDQNRSTTRFRLRLAHVHYFFERKLQLNALAGLRYDRTFHDPQVIKFDRLLPELEAKLRWQTPIPRLTALVGALLKYNWYLNSDENEANSFRPTYIPPTGPNVRPSWEDDYYSLTRQDLEWEISTELQVATWPRGIVALRYSHHQRLSNIDDAPTPVLVGTPPLPAPEYGYTRDLLLLELRHQF